MFLTENDVKKTCKVRHILDKSISVDEDNLIAPLKPVRYDCGDNADITSLESQLADAERQPPSILRRASCYEGNRESSSDSDSLALRRVSFPTDETELASFKEPECHYPWIICKL